MVEVDKRKCVRGIAEVCEEVLRKEVYNIRPGAGVVVYNVVGNVTLYWVDEANGQSLS